MHTLMIKDMKRFAAGLLLVCLFICRLSAQDFTWDDSLHYLVFRPPFAKQPRRFTFNNNLDYSVSLSGYYSMNGNSNKTDCQFAFNQNIRYNFSVGARSFHLSNNLVHSLGLLCYFDSLSRFQTDENTLTTRLSYDISGSIQISVSSILSTRIFNEWDVTTGPGGSVIRTNTSSFLTPMLGTFSGGVGFRFRNSGTLDIGISSAKLTFIRDRGIFDKTGRDTYLGIKRGRNSVFEYGLSLHLLIDRSVGKKIQWNCDLLLFKSDNMGMDLTFKNLFACKINRFLKTSLETRLFYDEDVSKQLRMENLLSLGFDFHL